MQQHPEQAHVDMSRRYAGTFSSPLWQVVPLLVLALLAFTGSGVHGDTVYLKNGSSIDGVFIGKHEGHVILQIGNLGKMEFPEEEVLTIEKNARTGPVNRKRNEKKSEENPLEKLDELKKSRKKPEEKSSQEALPIDPELESEIQALVYDFDATTIDETTPRREEARCDREAGDSLSSSSHLSPFRIDQNRGFQDLEEVSRFLRG